MSEYIVERIHDLTTGLDPFARREDIVRCRDCKYFNIDPNTDCCGFTDKYAHPNGFCSWGEKKECGEIVIEEPGTIRNELADNGLLVDDKDE